MLMLATALRHERPSREGFQGKHGQQKNNKHKLDSKGQAPPRTAEMLKWARQMTKCHNVKIHGCVDNHSKLKAGCR